MLTFVGVGAEVISVFLYNYYSFSLNVKSCLENLNKTMILPYFRKYGILKNHREENKNHR